MAQIDSTTTRDEITRTLDHAGIEWSRGPLTVAGVYDAHGAIRVGSSLLVHWDAEDPSCTGWAWRDEDSSGALDSHEELLRLAVDRDQLEQWLEAGDGAVYDDVGGLVELSEAGVAFVRAHGLTVDVDSYGCAYCPEHTIR